MIIQHIPLEPARRVLVRRRRVDRVLKVLVCLVGITLVGLLFTR